MKIELTIDISRGKDISQLRQEVEGIYTPSMSVVECAIVSSSSRHANSRSSFCPETLSYLQCAPFGRV